MQQMTDKEEIQDRMGLLQRLRTFSLYEVKYRDLWQKISQTKLLQALSEIYLILMSWPF